jgi:hypothetical protein
MDLEDLAGPARAVVSGATLGQNNKLAALMRQYLHGDDYATTLAQLQGKQDAYTEAHPTLAPTLEFAGSLAPFAIPGVNALMAGGEGIASAGRAAQLLRPLAGSAAVGAVTGGLSAPSLQDAPREALANAATFAAFPAAAKAFGAGRKALAFRGQPAEKALYDLLSRYGQ